MRPLVLTLALLAAPLPAWGCINDRKVEGAESEFRARYPDERLEARRGAPESLPLVAAGGLLLGAGALVARRRARAAR